MFTLSRNKEANTGAQPFSCILLPLRPLPNMDVFAVIITTTTRGLWHMNINRCCVETLVERTVAFFLEGQSQSMPIIAKKKKYIKCSMFHYMRK